VKWIVWALIIAVGLWLLVLALRWLTQWQRERAVERSVGAQAIRVALRLNELPNDCAIAAESAWNRGDRIAALSLLYRGALRFLLDHRNLSLRVGLTEEECVQAVTTQLEADTHTRFTAIARAWALGAYGGQFPAALTELLTAFRAAFVMIQPAASGAAARGAAARGAADTARSERG
jgi:hypothetical protein